MMRIVALGVILLGGCVGTGATVTVVSDPCTGRSGNVRASNAWVNAELLAKGYPRSWVCAFGYETGPLTPESRFASGAQSVQTPERVADFARDRLRLVGAAVRTLRAKRGG